MSNKQAVMTRIPTALTDEIGQVLDEIKRLGLDHLPQTRTAFLIQAANAYLPVIRARLERDRKQLQESLTREPTAVRTKWESGITGTPGKLLGD